MLQLSVLIDGIYNHKYSTKEHYTDMQTHIAPKIAELEPTDPTPFELIRARRGWNDNFLATINAAPADQLGHIDDAISLIHQMITDDKEITVLTDFDMDGIASGVLTYAGIAELGGQVNLVIPDYTGSRDVEPSDIDHALTLYPDTALFITCDQGTNSTAGITHAQSRGVKVMITDHHHQEVDCPADVLVNPNATDSTYSQPDICGAQVAYHVLHHYAMTYNGEAIPAIELLRMFAGIGALADVMPLTGQTRALIKQALPLMRLCLPEVELNPWGSGWDKDKALQAKITSSTMMQMINLGEHDYRYARAFYGFSLLLRQFIATGKLRSAADINVGFIGFTLAPTFNATRRVEGDMHDSFQLFAPQSVQVSRPDYDLSQTQAAQALIDNNEIRKAATKTALAEMDTTTFDRFIAFADAPAGIMGLLASNLTRATGEPAVVLNPYNLSGSGRAPEWFNIIDVVAATGDPALSAQGHQQACGVRVNTENDLEALYEAIATAVAAVPAEALAPANPDLVLIDVPRDTALAPDQREWVYRLGDMNMPEMSRMADLITQLSHLGPFGHGLTYPDIRIIAQLDDCEVRVLGSDSQHIKITTPSGLACLWWNSSEHIDDLTTGGLAEFEVELSINMFRGEKIPQGIVRSVSVNGRSLA